MSISDINIINKTQYIPDFLEIRYSNIKNAGLGIFCKKKINKGTFLGNYVGIIKDIGNINNGYSFTSVVNGKNVEIDGSNIEYSNWTRFMNCSYDIFSENVLAIKCQNTETYFNNKNEKISLNGIICFFADRDIEEGEELLYDYGIDYRNVLKIEDYKKNY